LKKIIPEIEEKSPLGFHIKVRQHRNSFIIFKPDGNPERLNLANPNEIINPLKTIAFIGSGFDIRSHYLGLAFLPVKNSRILIPYKHRRMNQEKAILIHTPSQSDLLPMRVEIIPDAVELMQLLKTGKIIHYLVVDDELPRPSVLQIKERMAKVYLFVIKISAFSTSKEPGKKLQGEKFDDDRVRATDLIDSGNEKIELLSQNPVFLARIFLRNLELAKVKSLFLEKSMKKEDTDFIKTFLEIMIRNDQKKPELQKAKKELEMLTSYVEMLSLMIEKRLEEVSEVILRENNRDKIIFYDYLIKRYKNESQIREEQIKFWELEAIVKTRLDEIKS